ncbi:MAG: hypothetical protein ACTHNG_00110 [Ginsengibacter sp.]
MKTHLYTCLFLVAIILFFISCKKEKDNQTTSQKVIGTWQMQSDIYHENVQGVEYSDTTLGMGATLEFKTNGKVYYNFLGQQDSANYTIKSDSVIDIVDVDTYDIKTLTTNQFVLFSKSVDSSGTYEETINLIK